MVAAVAYMAGRWLALLMTLPRPERFATVTASIMALLYSAAAGFTLPTQRALLMLTVVFAAAYYCRQLQPASAFLAALLLCLLWDPLAANSASFYLSFLAVAAILTAILGRRYFGSGLVMTLRKRGFVRAQYAVMVALLPVLAVILGQYSFIAPLVNLVAIPLFSLVIVPFILLVLHPVNTASNSG